MAGLQTTWREALRKEMQSADLHGAVRAHEGRHEKLEFAVLEDIVEEGNSLKEGLTR